MDQERKDFEHTIEKLHDAVQKAWRSGPLFLFCGRGRFCSTLINEKYSHREYAEFLFVHDETIGLCEEIVRVYAEKNNLTLQPATDTETTTKP